MAECEHLARTTAYFDGALAEADQAAALDHLAGCAECQSVLGDAVVLDAAMSAAPRAPAEVAAPVTARRWLRSVAVIGGLAAAAAVAFVMWPRPVPEATQVALELPHERTIEARFTGERFAAHRPYSVLRGDRATEAISLATLAQLEQHGDRRELFAALVATGDLERARKLATELPADAGGESDRAALALAAHQLEPALEHAYRAVELDPGLAAAHWNVGIAARELGLPRVSRDAFATVAKLAEPGWAAEARAQIVKLDHELAVDADFGAFEQRAHAMIAGGPPLAVTDVAQFPAHARGYVLDALRLRSGPDVAPLRALVDALDAASGKPTLAAAAAIASSGDRTLRARFADRYRALLAGTVTGAEAEQLVTDLRAAGHTVDDLRAGAILHGGLAAAHVEELRAIVAPWHDPWFDLAVERARIAAELAKDDERAEAALTDALATCDNNPAWSLRCGELAQDLAQRLVDGGRAADAERWAVRALAAYRLAGSPAHAKTAREQLAEIHRTLGRTALARAELEELALSGQSAPPSP